jgi:hypothetical protein
MSRSPVKINQRFKETCHLHLQGWRVRQTSNQIEASSKLLHPGFLPGLVMELTFTRLHSITSQQLELFIGCKNFKSYIWTFSQNPLNFLKQNKLFTF